MRILIADDDKSIREELVNVVKLASCNDISLDEADSGKLVLEKIRTAEYDLIISDYLMPEKTGLETAREARAKGYTGKLWIFSGNYKIKDDALAAGADDFYEKANVLDWERLQKDLANLVMDNYVTYSPFHRSYTDRELQNKCNISYAVLYNYNVKPK